MAKKKAKTKKKAKKANETPKVAMPGCRVPDEDEGVPEVAWKAHQITWEEDGTPSIGTSTTTIPKWTKEWLIAKSFMLKQQELLAQLQADFSLWLKWFVAAAEKEKP